MKEVVADSKWEDEGGSLGRSEGQHLHFEPNEYEVDESAVELMTAPAGPTEDGQLAILMVLMRIYDVQMALLSVHDESTANEIYEAHEAGNSFNPPLYIPQFGVKTDAEDSD